MTETHLLSRQDLYELVWARPETQIAAEFGISDVALHEICKKHRVPVPALYSFRLCDNPGMITRALAPSSK